MEVSLGCVIMGFLLSPQVVTVVSSSQSVGSKDGYRSGARILRPHNEVSFLYLSLAIPPPFESVN